MDGPRDYHTMQRQPERERRIYDITFIWNLKYSTNEYTNVSVKPKQIQRHKERTCGCQRKGEKDGRGVWGCKTITYRMDKQQTTTV